MVRFSSSGLCISLAKASSRDLSVTVTFFRMERMSGAASTEMITVLLAGSVSFSANRTTSQRLASRFNMSPICLYVPRSVMPRRSV
ncbi:MAG: hypothetical protein FJZ88_10880 [Chloroflexi bacterium]|nr:hypothetical protein [Chloroflexota bacterium]